MALPRDKHRDGDGLNIHDELGRYHCDYGPACIHCDGTQEWYHHGKLHREDGPAVIYPEGSHAEPDGKLYFFLYDKVISKEFHEILTRGPLDELPLYLGMGFDKFIEKRLCGNV